MLWTLPSVQIPEAETLTQIEIVPSCPLKSDASVEVHSHAQSLEPLNCAAVRPSPIPVAPNVMLLYSASLFWVELSFATVPEDSFKAQ